MFFYLSLITQIIKNMVYKQNTQVRELKLKYLFHKIFSRKAKIRFNQGFSPKKPKMKEKSCRSRLWSLRKFLNLKRISLN